MIEFYQHILISVVIGFTWSEILTQPSEMFSWAFKLIDKLPFWLSKPLGGCAKCFSGQIAFWTYIVVFPYQYSNILLSIYLHIYFVSLTILAAWLLQKATEKF
jgi:hypothetical protein